MPLGRIGDYELLESLGKGGMSVVFKARDSRLGRTVALKILPQEYASDPERRARLLREARAGASLSHSAIAACFDVGEAELDPPDLLAPGTPGPHPSRVLFMSMEYVPGADLSSLVGHPPVSIERVIDIGTQIASGLEAAHASGVVHRDLKPTNVRVMPGDRIKIIDLGLARFTTAAPDATTTTDLSGDRVLGTAHFMSPEQANAGVADARSDLFSLGTILYQLVTGHLPFEGETYNAVLYNVSNHDPPPLARYASNVPLELERIVRKLLEKTPSRRYQSAHEVVTDLERLAETGGTADGADPHHPPRPWRRILALAGVVAAVTALAWWGTHRVPQHGRSLAVMPFRNRTGNARLDYLGEGLANDVWGRIVRHSHLNVASFASVLSLDSTKSAAPAVASELGVGAVLEGSLHQSGGSITLDVELTDGHSGTVIWTERYDYTLANAFTIEDAIVRNVTQRLAGRSPTVAPTNATRSLSAYDLHLKASALLDDPDDRQAPDRALEMYEQALALDPDFALAWAGESRAQVLIWNRDKTPAAIRRAEEAADRAVRLNPNLVEAHIARAQVYRQTSRFAEAIRELQALQAINPDWDEVEIQLGAAYRDAGDLTLAEAHVRKAALERPDYWRIHNFLGALLTRRGDYAGARAEFQNVVRLAPENVRGYEQLAAVAGLTGNFKAAIAAYERLPVTVEDGLLASNIGAAYFFDRRMPESRRYFQRAVEFEPRNPTFHMNLGDWYLRTGDVDSARTQFSEASRLIGELLQVTPKSQALWLDRALCQAKLGDCAGAAATIATQAGALPDSNADAAHEVARIEALCGRRERALEALRRAVTLGITANLIRAEDEFLPLASDPRFAQALASGH